MDMFWDTASREHAKTKLCTLPWIPRDVDTFIAQFRNLAEQAQYALNDCPTIMLLLVAIQNDAAHLPDHQTY